MTKLLVPRSLCSGIESICVHAEPFVLLRLAYYMFTFRYPFCFTLAVVVLFLLNNTPVFAQEPDTVRVSPDSIVVVQTDSSKIKARKRLPIVGFFTRKYPDPRKAALLAAVLPGTGQAYNKKWWKVPIVYGALGGMTWWTVDNVRTYHEYRDNYKLLVDGDPDTNPTDPKYLTVSTGTLREYRDRFRKYSEQSYLGLGLLYLLSVTDAFVDAHLYNFDVSDDLSMRLVPSLQSSPGFGATFGLGVQIPIR